VVIVAFMAVFGGIGGIPCLFGGAGAGGGTGSGGVEPSSAAVSEIPPEYLRLYRQAGGRYDVDWTILASIGAQESNHGRNAVSSSAGCIGVMQLCGAFTTAPIAQDGNADGDIQLNGTDDIADSIASAANGFKKLKNAPPAGSSYAAYRQPVCDYYGACADSNANYADEVMARAVQYGFKGAGSPAATNSDAGPADPGPQRTLLNLGDSLAVGAGGPLPDALSGWTVETDAQTSRPTAAGVARLEARGDDLPSVLAISLGTNDSPDAKRTFRRHVERVLEVAGTNRCVLWAEIQRPPENGVSYSGLNEVLRDVAGSNPNLKIIDATGERAGDRVHLTPAGYRTRADAIADAARSCIADLDPAAAAAGAGSGNCGGGETGGAGGLEGIGSSDALALATNPNITWANGLLPTNDLRSGRISPRLVSLLSVIAERHKITVTALASDHKPGTNHEAGRAVDIAIVDGEVCNSSAHGRSGKCWALAVDLGRIKGLLAPTELIFGIDPDGAGPAFARSDHTNHIHAGFDGPLGPKHYNPDVSPNSPEAITGSGG